MKIAISNFQHKYHIPQQQIISTVQLSIKKLRLKLSELSIVFVGEKRMRVINKTHLRHDEVTDVITFNYTAARNGEIIICPCEASRNAKCYKNSVDRELVLYVVHGLLHLAGYDDHKPKDIEEMRKMEKKLLAFNP